MQMFEYVIVLISIVIGLALTHLMQGIAGLIQNPTRSRIWWVHLVWVAYMILSIVFWWWWEFNLQQIKVWTFSIYLFVIFYAFYLYLIAAVLFPSRLEGYEGYQDYFMARRHWFFGLVIGWAGIDVIDTWMKGAEWFAVVGRDAIVFNSILALTAIIGIAVRRPAVQAILAVGQLAYVLFGLLRLFDLIHFGTT